MVSPGTPEDAKGLLKSAIRSNDPILFIEHATMYQVRGEVPDEEYLIPIGKSKVQREGSDLTIVTYCKGLELSMKAAEELAREGIEADALGHHAARVDATYQDGVVRESAIVEKPTEILMRWPREGRHPDLFVGDGALRYRDLIHSADPNAHIVDPLPPLAPAVARLAATYIELHGPASPDAIRPLYIRRSDAELARDRVPDGGLPEAEAESADRRHRLAGEHDADRADNRDEDDAERAGRGVERELATRS